MLVRSVSKFDIAHHAPMPDKVGHVSNKDDKQRLRDVLYRDTRLRPLLRGLRQALDYEALPSWQPPPAMAQLTAAIEAASASFWKQLASGSFASRLGTHTPAAERHAYAHAPHVPPSSRRVK